MAHVATLILVFPLLGFLGILINGRNMSERAIGVVGTTAIGLSFVASVVTFFQLLGRSDREVTVHLFTWISVGTLHVPAALLVDPLSITMCLFVTGISTLIHLYSTGYMHQEKDFRKFFTYLNLFVFAMLVLVLANNLVMTFVGWESGVQPPICHSENEHGWQVVHCASAAAIFIGWYVPSTMPRWLPTPSASNEAGTRTARDRRAL